MSATTNGARLGKFDVIKNDQYLGTIRKFMDKNHSDPNSVQLLSGLNIVAAYVKNSTASPIAPGTGVVTANAALAKEIGALSGANGRFDGVVDPFLPSSLPVGAYGWIIVGGPCKVLLGTGGITQGGVLQTDASGTFIALTDGDTYAVGRAGIADAAGSAASLCRVYLTPRESVFFGAAY